MPKSQCMNRMTNRPRAIATLCAITAATTLLAALNTANGAAVMISAACAG